MSEKPESAGDLVQSQSPTSILSEWGFGRLAKRYYTSINKSEPDSQKRLFSLIQSRGEKIDDYINKEIRIVEYLFTPAVFTDDSTGEEITTVVSKLRLADGKVIETHSIGIASSLQTATELIGSPSRKRPYNCEVRKVPCRNSRSMIILEFKE